MIRAAALLLLALAGCGGGDLSGDGGADSGAGDDLSASPDLGGPVDATCALQLFTGFLGTTVAERRIDCSCGCILDRFENNVIAGFWGTPVTAGASFQPTDAGLSFLLAPPDGGLAIAAVNSQAPVAPFYLDGDYDLLVDYRLSGPLPPGGHAIVNVQDVTPNGRYTVEREKTAAPADVYGATLGGIPEVTIATTASSGTLELSRSGSTVRASADGAQVSQFTGASNGRVILAITGALADCGGGPCAVTVTFHNARMTAGALVDRR